MGNRAQVEVAGVYIYTQFGGSRAKQRVAEAIDIIDDRIEDAPYLARVVVDRLEEDATGEATGVGISATPYSVGLTIRLWSTGPGVEVLDHGEYERFSFAEFEREYKAAMNPCD